MSKVLGSCCCVDDAPEFGDIGGDDAVGVELGALPAAMLVEALLLIAAFTCAACCNWSPLVLLFTREVGDEPKPSDCCGRCGGGGSLVVVDSGSKADMIQAA